jgi:cytochrome oxidase assembly protein ShyY1
VLRTATKPRWLALLVLALALATGMAALGQWQLDRFRANSHREAVRAATSRPAVPLGSLLRARQSFTNADADRPVTSTGRWDAAHQLLVADRYLDGARGLWVLTPLVLDDGSAVAVVRGWVPAATDPAASTAGLPGGPVRIAGVLRPGEPPVDHPPGAGAGLPPGQVDGVDLTQLVQRWPKKQITGYVVLTDARPPAGSAGLRQVPPTAPSNQAVAWQNLSYAVEWFVFAAFLLLLWFRLVRDDHRGRLPAASASASASAEGASASAEGASASAEGAAVSVEGAAGPAVTGAPVPADRSVRPVGTDPDGERLAGTAGPGERSAGANPAACQDHLPRIDSVERIDRTERGAKL